MTLTMLEFRRGNEVVCVCSAEDGSGLDAYVLACRKKFKLDYSVTAYLRRFEAVPPYRRINNLEYKTCDIITLHV